MPGQVRIVGEDAFHLADVGVVLARELLGVAPLAFPVLRVDHDIFDLHALAAVEHGDPLGDLEIVGNGDARVDIMVLGLDIFGLHDQRLALPVPDGLAIIGMDHRVRIAEAAPVEVDHAEGIGEAGDHVDRRGNLDEGVRPDAGHDHRHAGGEALADRIAIGRRSAAAFCPSS